MTKEVLIRLLKKRQGERSLREFANEVKVTASYLNDIYQGRRDPGPAVLEYLGVRRDVRVVYLPIK